MGATGASKRSIQPRDYGGGATRWYLAGRLALVAGGGYATTAVLVAGATAALPLTGLHRTEGVVLASMLGFVVYLALLVWGFADRKPRRFAFGLSLLVVVGFALIVTKPLSGG